MLNDKRRADLDGLRGIAISLVLMVHIAASTGVAGRFSFVRFFPTGVTLFFVLSGYLITSILLDGRGRRGYFRDFYWRRACRILPLYFLFTLVTIGLELLGIFNSGVERSSWALFPLFLQNLLPFVGSRFDWPVNITWSLCVEEHFYLIWPLVIALASRRLAIGLCFMFLGASASTYFLFPREILWFFTLTNIYGLVLGSLIALGVVPKHSWVIGALAAVSLIFYPESHLWQLRFGVMFYAVVAHAHQIELLKCRPLVYLGQRSYGLYLWHAVVIVGLQARVLHNFPWWASGLIYLFISLVVAEISYRYYEAPFLRLKNWAGNYLVSTSGRAGVIK